MELEHADHDEHQRLLAADKYYPTPGHNGSGTFSDKVLSDWLTKNRGVQFPDGPSHGLWAYLLGSINISSTFFIIGDTTNVKITGLNLDVPHLD